MTDRELMKLAAKAAGIEHGLDRLDCGVSLTLPDGRHGHLPKWNPLTDDGDALRLAVKLNLTLRCYMDHICAQASVPGGPSVYITEFDADDPCVATRRAIVRAAAEIGKAMP